MTTSILTKWDNVCNDESWVSSLFYWYEKKDSAVRIDITARPKVFEATQLRSRQPGGGWEVVGEESQLYARYSAPSFAASSSSSSSSSALPLRKTQLIRHTDQHTLRTTPLAFYYQAMTNAVDEERSITIRAELRILAPRNSALLPVGGRVEVRFGKVSSFLWRFQVWSPGSDGELLSEGEVEHAADKPVQRRYDMTRIIHTEPKASRNSQASRELPGTSSIVETTPFFEFEMANTQTGNGWLHLADIGVCQVWEHAFPVGSDFYTVLQPNGRRRYACMWRGAATQVFDHSRVRSGGAFRCMVWIDRTGGSTFDARADFLTTGGDDAVLVAAVRFTIIAVDIPTMKPRPVFYDKAWAEQRYAYGSKLSPIKRESFDLPMTRQMWTDVPVKHTYVLELRHSDHDLNGHVNSGRYMTLIEDARWEAGVGGAPRSDSADWIKAFWIEYDEELHLSPSHPAYIEVKEHGSFAQFVFLYGGPKRKVCSVVTVECLTTSAAARL